MIKAVFFDLDNTLYSFDKGTALGNKAFGEYFEKTFGISKEEAMEDWREMMNMEIERLGIHNAAYHSRIIRAKRCLMKRGLPQNPHARILANLYWDTLLDNLEIEDGIEELLKALKGKGIFIGCGTNMTAEIQHEKIHRLGLEKYFDTIVCSDEAAEEKPFKGFFDYCLTMLDAKPEECVFIGDDIENDIYGSKNAGWNCAWYTKYPKPGNEERAAELGVENRIDSYRECLRDGKIYLGKIEI